jgi:Domain of unknown function (DUF4157)
VYSREVVHSETAPPVRGALLMRCGGVSCPPGTCDHDDSLMQRQAAGSGPRLAPPVVHDVLSTAGRPLDTGFANTMGARLGFDFSRVRIHDDEQAAASARMVAARAYTVGRDIVLDSGQYRPDTADGRRLLTHELTHVMQQRTHRGPPPRELAVGESEDPCEHQAERLAQGVDVAVPASGDPVLRRQVDDTFIYRRCREQGVPCGRLLLNHGRWCRLSGCYRSRTYDSSRFGYSPGTCSYACPGGYGCTCVMVGTRNWAVCAIKLCSDEPANDNARAEQEADRGNEGALAAAGPSDTRGPTDQEQV